MNPITRYILKLIFVMALQIVAIKNLELGFANWWLTSFVYIVIILDLPVKFSPLIAMLIGGGLGFTIDIFYNTYGMHTSAGIFIAFARHYFIGIILPRDGFDTGSALTIKNVGIAKYLTYICVMSVTYHLWFFILEAFSFHSFFQRLSQSIVSGLFAAAIMWMLHLYFTKPPKK